MHFEKTAKVKKLNGEHAHMVKAQNWDLLIPTTSWSKLDLLVIHIHKGNEIPRENVRR